MEFKIKSKRAESQIAKLLKMYVGRKELEQEREKLHHLIEEGASREAIQHQSEIVDKHIVEHYSIFSKLNH